MYIFEVLKSEVPFKTPVYTQLNGVVEVLGKLYLKLLYFLGSSKPCLQFISVIVYLVISLNLNCENS